MEAYLEHLILFVSEKYVVYTKYFCPPEQYYTLRPGSTFGFSVILSLSLIKFVALDPSAKG